MSKLAHHHGDQLDTRSDTRRGLAWASKCTNWEEIVPGTSSSAHTHSWTRCLTHPMNIVGVSARALTKGSAKGSDG